MEHFITNLNSYLWGWQTIFLILLTGLIITIRTRAIQIRGLFKAFIFSVKNEKGEKGEISAFSSLCASLSSTIGTGNIVGVASAISLGGPGALFWMLFASLLGMATKFFEGFLAVKYREKRYGGHYLGGPFFYIEKGLSERFGQKKLWKILSFSFCVFCIASSLLGVGTITQSNSIASAAEQVISSPVLFVLCGKKITVTSLLSSLFVTFFTALSVFGGIKRIARVSEFLVPFMTLFYLFFSVIIIFSHIHALPTALWLIIKSAFCPSAVGGGIVGLSIKSVVSEGIRKGVFSNEAGLGTSPIAAAAAKTSSPVRQGLVNMLSAFIDTAVICNITGLCIVITGAWDKRITGEALKGFDITAFAWKKGLPFSSDTAVSFLSFSLILFAFTTVIGWNYYAECCLEFVLGERKSSAVFYFRLLYLAAVAIGPFLSVTSALSIADSCNALMALPNLFSLLLLNKTVLDEKGLKKL